MRVFAQSEEGWLYGRIGKSAGFPHAKDHWFESGQSQAND